MDNPWYSFYVGDYRRKTAHLSMLEHAAYRLLLDHYYATRLPLPNDATKLYRICGARSPSERKAVLLVTTEFFTKTESILKNKRCDSEIEKLLNYSNRQSAAAKLRHSHGTATAQPRARVPLPQSQIKKEANGFQEEEKSKEEKDKQKAQRIAYSVRKLGQCLPHDETWLEEYEEVNGSVGIGSIISTG